MDVVDSGVVVVTVVKGVLVVDSGVVVVIISPVVLVVDSGVVVVTVVPVVLVVASGLVVVTVVPVNNQSSYPLWKLCSYYNCRTPTQLQPTSNAEQAMTTLDSSMGNNYCQYSTYI